MDEEAIQKQKQAFTLMEKVLSYGQELVKPGVKILDLAEAIEGKIKELGADIAFPANISINDIAAHYTPDIDDPTTLKEGDLVKIDQGLHVDGYIADFAYSIRVGKLNDPMIEAAKHAVEVGLTEAKPGVKISELSAIIEDTITSAGFNIVRNLTGHGLGRFKVHTEPAIPNVRNNSTFKLEAGKAIAIEVFVTKGSGWVKDSEPKLIYAYKADKAVRLPEAKKILKMAKEDFHTLPFAKRWLKDISRLKLGLALRELVETEALEVFPTLREISGAEVAQWERSKIVE